MLTWLVPAVIKSVKIEGTHSQMKDAVVFIPHCLALQILAEKESCHLLNYQDLLMCLDPFYRFPLLF